MAIAIPKLPVAQSTFKYVSSASDQKPTFAGPTQRVARLGDKWVYSVELKPLYAIQARVLISILLPGLSAKVLCPVKVEGVSLVGQTDVTASSGAGKTIQFTGSAAGKSAGQYFSLVKNGVRYLHMVTGVTGQTVTFIPALKVPITGGEVMEFAEPKIEGFLSGNEQEWSIKTTSATLISLTIEEAQ